MVDVDREGEAIQLEDESIVPYDWLVITSGRSESSSRKLYRQQELARFVTCLIRRAL